MAHIPERRPVPSVAPRRPPRTATISLKGRIGRTDVPGLCERAHRLVQRTEAELLICDVSAVVDPDAVTVDALARLQLTVRRLGRRMRIHHACGELLELLDFAGLSDVVPCAEG